MTVKEFVTNYKCVFIIEERGKDCIKIKTELYRREDHLYLESVVSIYNFLNDLKWIKTKNMTFPLFETDHEEIISLGKKEQLNQYARRAGIIDFNPMDQEFDRYMFYI